MITRQILIEYAHKKDAKVLTIAPKAKPKLLPLIDIIFDANTELTATPPIITAVGKVAKYLTLINVEPIIPLSKIVTTGGVEEKICEIVSMIKFLLNTTSKYRLK